MKGPQGDSSASQNAMEFRYSSVANSLVLDDALSVVAALGRLTRDRSYVIFGQLLGIGSHLGRYSPSIAACAL